ALEDGQLEGRDRGHVFGPAPQSDLRPPSQGARAGAWGVDEHSVVLERDVSRAHRPIDGKGMPGSEPHAKKLVSQAAELLGMDVARIHGPRWPYRASKDRGLVAAACACVEHALARQGSKSQRDDLAALLLHRPCTFRMSGQRLQLARPPDD